jgi:energy-converting hydrogenase Eha subunit A
MIPPLTGLTEKKPLRREWANSTARPKPVIRNVDGSGTVVTAMS